MRVLGIVASLILASSTLVQADVYERPKYSVGDTWSYTHGVVTTIVKVSEESLVQTRASPCPTCQWVVDKDGTLTQV